MASDNVYGTPLSGDAGTILNGMAVRMSANNRVVRAQADSAANVRGLIGVNGSGFVELGGPVNAVSAAVRQPVLCEAGLTLTAGDPLFVSDTQAGYATNVEPPIAVAFAIVEDVGSYALTGRVFAAISPAGGGGTGGGCGGCDLPNPGANLPDTDTTVNPASDSASIYRLLADTLTNNRTLTLGVAGSPVTNSIVQIIRHDLTANTYTVNDDAATPLFTFPASPTTPQAATFFFDGTHYVFLNFFYVEP